MLCVSYHTMISCTMAAARTSHPLSEQASGGSSTRVHSGTKLRISRHRERARNLQGAGTGFVLHLHYGTQGPGP